MTNLEAMENGNIRNDEQQVAYEKAIEALSLIDKMEKEGIANNN